MLYVFTLHKSEEDFRVWGTVLARSPQEAASIIGGEYVACDGQPPASSIKLDELNLYGKVRFASELFRQYSNKELSQMKLDYTPSKLHYEKFPGFVLWANSGEAKEFVLRRNFVVLPNTFYNLDVVMKRKSFLRAFLDGLASIGEGMASLSPFSSSCLPSYEERFGTDAERLASDWQKVENDLHNVMQDFEDEKKP